MILGDGSSIPIERELVDTINGSTSRNDTEATFNNKGNSSQENEVGDYNVENEIRRRDVIVESMETFSNEIKMRLGLKKWTL